MKVLINDNKTITASALENYITAAGLSAEVTAVPVQTMLAAVLSEKPAVVIRYLEEINDAELRSFFSNINAYNAGICRILIAGSKNLQSISEELSGLVEEILVYPFASQELMIRLRRLFGRTAGSEPPCSIPTARVHTAAQQYIAPAAAAQEAAQQPLVFPVAQAIQKSAAVKEPLNDELFNKEPVAAAQTAANGQPTGREDAVRTPFSPQTFTAPSGVTIILKWDNSEVRVISGTDISTQVFGPQQAGIAALSVSQPNAAAPAETAPLPQAGIPEDTASLPQVGVAEDTAPLPQASVPEDAASLPQTGIPEDAAPLPQAAIPENTALLPETVTPTDAVEPPQTDAQTVEGKETGKKPQKGIKKTSTVKKAFSVIGRAITVLVILLVAALSVLILTSRMNDGTPTVFGYRFYTVLTGSMSGKRPDSFNKGSLILVKPVNPEEVKTGDIITFDRKTDDSKLTTHRVKVVNVDANGDLSFTTQGDANAVPDSVPVPENIVKGKVIFSVARVGDVVRFAQTSTGMIFFVFIPAGAIVIYEIYIFIQEHADRKRAKKEADAVKKDK